ncbi:Response regulator receiver domain-containing protein [Sinomicrobium oceani]|uniref:histidine kinase n=1 Tax=Sinomicrobium oceani TaxID=1150368 RepID=A0A1K1Q2M3_9FLAO|nr:hybrid sensor histidine kinase/response regulator [Sinomicrobium oceani]SFW53923.1 Response regulator receiver domain-containing protein [Sinomicrobium oceani]
MLHVKGKTLLMFALSAVAIASIGFYFYISLQSLSNRVEKSINPQKRSNHLKKIALDLNKLNNLYLIDSIKFSSRKVDSIIASIEVNLDSIEQELKNSDILSEYSQLDTIPRLLREIQSEYLVLEDIKQKSQERFVNDLENVLKEELSRLNLSARDSVTIIKQITSEIYENPVVSNGGRIIDQEKIDKDDKGNFFRRLFGRTGKDESAAEKTTYPKELQRRKRNRDTIVSTSVDTLLTPGQPEEAPEMKIISIFEKIQQRRSDILENIENREKQIFQKNAEINNYIEGILNEILFEELSEFNRYIDDFSSDSRKYIYETGIIILIFLILGLVATFVIFRDVNKSIFYHKKLEQSERRALREAEEKQRFLSTMSHELRTPLTSIIGYADMLDQKDENVQALQSASNYLYQMTNEILDMAKIKAGIIEIKEENFDLLVVMEKIRSNFEPLIINRGIQPIFILPSEPVYIISDEYRIQQIIYNLAHNALKYTEEGFIRVELETREHEKDKEKLDVRISIEDSGIGISEEEQKTIFKDYQQAGTHKNKIKGTGLGLGIVKRVVKEMGGKLKLESKEQEGSKFTVGFTFAKGERKEEEHEGEFRMPANGLQGVRILAVDDDPLITRLYEKLVVPYGADFKAINDPKAALVHLRTESYDLVIFDMKMPGLSGYALKKELEKEGIVLRNTIIATANVMLTPEDASRMESFDRILFKPLRKTNVLKTISDLLGLENVSEKGDEEGKGIYDLTDLKAYTGDDEEALQEIVELMIGENKKELVVFKQALDDRDYDALANVVHKMASRFAQVRISPPMPVKALELQLRDENKQAYGQARALYVFWKAANQKMEREFLENGS